MSAHETDSLWPRGACYSSANISVPLLKLIVFSFYVAIHNHLCVVLHFLVQKVYITQVHKGVHSNSI